MGDKYLRTALQQMPQQILRDSQQRNTWDMILMILLAHRHACCTSEVSLDSLCHHRPCSMLASRFCSMYSRDPMCSSCAQEGQHHTGAACMDNHHLHLPHHSMQASHFCSMCNQETRYSSPARSWIDTYLTVCMYVVLFFGSTIKFVTSR